MEHPDIILICAGQSNMVGQGDRADLSAPVLTHGALFWDHEHQQWTSQLPDGETTFGPEVGFAEAIGASLPELRIGLVKHAVGGTSLLAWHPNWSADRAAQTKNADAGPLYAQLQEQITAARAVTPDAPIAGCLWMQGERDTIFPDATQTYYENLLALVTRLRHDVRVPDLPFVLGRVNPPHDEKRPGYATVREAQEQVGSSVSAQWVDVDDLSMHADQLHFDSVGQRELGHRMALAWMSLRHGLALPQHPDRIDHGGPAQINLRTGTAGHRHCLMIGNSLTHFQSMPAMLRRLLSAADDQPWVVSSITRGGATLAWHRAMGYADRALNNGYRFDAVTIQDQSRRPAQFALESEADFRHFIQCAQDNQAVPVAYLTWNLMNEPPLLGAMQATLAPAVDGTAGRVAPAGPLWEEVRRAYPDMALHLPDNKHPTVAGSFLAALALCYSICGRLPEEIPAMLAAGGYQELPLTPEVQVALLAIAQRTCDSFEKS
jgi:hypothetical protein